MCNAKHGMKNQQLTPSAELVGPRVVPRAPAFPLSRRGPTLVGARQALCVATARASEQSANTVVLVLRTRHLDHIAVVVDVLGLLTQDEALEELGQDLVGSQKFDRRAILADVQYLGHDILCDLPRLRRQDAEGELAELGRGVVEQQVREDHAGREDVAIDLAKRLDLVVALHTILELRDQGVGHLRQTALRGAIGHIAGGASALHAAADGVEDVRFHAVLLLHHHHRSMCAHQDATQVDLHNRLDGFRRNLREALAPTVDARVVNPIVDDSDLVLYELNKLLDALEIAHIADGAVDGCVRVLRLQSVHGWRRVIDIADDDAVAPLQELVRVGPAHSGGAAGDDDARNDRATVHRHGLGTLPARGTCAIPGALPGSGR
eukprot:CAMPEP_0177523664 /NCGR_PEP_ID=MMETSP0369-20130122/49520_1 /TAXON_ID=447022 ORGANISM="Scrippsiella hangoei-like, Strain SHHI-4" /NCGR_SAMPLE_ID=MMETSP0369 /ASSEMBLY_ACC=CAM_ASM_000364 /LENGTH=377 /DNA_ID=CAMNT_0019003535 /DNA_START=115 /DNA_END=1245 /DNA_ORIENTATION=-